VFSEDGPFGTVVLDPPWDMQKIDREVRPNQDAFDYPVMKRPVTASRGSPNGDQSTAAGRSKRLNDAAPGRTRFRRGNAGRRAKRILRPRTTFPCPSQSEAGRRKKPGRDNAGRAGTFGRASTGGLQ